MKGRLLLIPAFLICATPLFAQDNNADSNEPQSIDVNALIERLSDELDKEFILDRRMSGVFGGTTAGEDADYETLLGMLRSSGWMAIETADQILLAPEATARTQPTRLLQEDDSSVSDHEFVTRVIELPELEVPATMRGVDGEFVVVQSSLASSLVPILRPMMAQNAQLGNPAGTNKLVIVDRYDNVRRLTAVIDEIIGQQTRRR